MRIGNYPVCDESGNQIDADYLETNSIHELSDALTDCKIYTATDTEPIDAQIKIAYSEEDNRVVFNMQEQGTIKNIASISITALEFADILHIACSDNYDINMVNRIIGIKKELTDIATENYLSLDNTYNNVSGYIVADDIVVGTFEDIRFSGDSSFNDNKEIGVSKCIFDKLNKYIGKHVDLYFSYKDNIYKSTCTVSNGANENIDNTLIKDIVIFTAYGTHCSKINMLDSSDMKIHYTAYEPINIDFQNEDSVNQFYMSRKRLINSLIEKNIEERNEFDNIFEL